MDKLKKLKETYEKLGDKIKELELEQKTLEQDKVQVNGHPFYPIFCRYKRLGFVVKFTGEKSGVVVTSNTGGYELNHTSDSWWIHTDNSVWERIAVCPETGFYDKQPVWCWDDGDECVRYIKFYDAKNHTTFNYKGERIGCSHDNYKPYEGEWMDWMKEAYNKLDT